MFLSLQNHFVLVGIAMWNSGPVSRQKIYFARNEMPFSVWEKWFDGVSILPSVRISFITNSRESYPYLQEANGGHFKSILFCGKYPWIFFFSLFFFLRKFKNLCVTLEQVYLKKFQLNQLSCFSRFDLKSFEFLHWQTYHITIQPVF